MDYEPALNEPLPKSTHRCDVVEVHPQPHPNADRLEVVEVYGYSVCVGKGNFKDGDLGIYIPPDSIVPQTEAFRWVWEAKGYAPPPDGDNTSHPIVPEKYRRIKAKVLRGIPSEGILLTMKEAFPSPVMSIRPIEAGDDMAPALGIIHYDPPEDTNLAGDCEAAPDKPKKKKRYPKTFMGWCRFLWHKVFPKPAIVGHEENTGLTIPDYDVDSWQRHKNILQLGEPVWVTEKIHGSNSRFVYMPTEGRMYVGSHYQWKKDIPGSAFWDALRQNRWIEAFCRAYPGYVLYGELVPTQKKMTYGRTKGKYKVLVFDILNTNPVDGYPRGHWLSRSEINYLYFYLDEIAYAIGSDKFWVPTIYVGPYNENQMRELASGPSLVPGAQHIREGIVVKPLTERVHHHFGRVILKLVSTKYLESKQSEE